MMSLAPASGIIALASSVRLTFERDGVDAVVPPVGLKSRSLWGRSRVVFIPGEFSGDGSPRPMREGRLTAPEHTKSDDPRELATLERIITAAILAVDRSDLQNEEAQIAALDRLFELTVQAVYNAVDPATGQRAGQGSLVFEGGSVTRVYPPVEMAYGGELLWVFTQRGPFFDAPSVTVTPGFRLTRTLSAPSP